MALTDNLAAGYALDEASGNFLDVLGSNDLTIANSPGTTTGKVGNARTFGGNTSGSHADNATLSTGDINFSVMQWVNTNTTSGFPVSVNKGWQGTGNANREHVFYLNAGVPTAEFGFGTSSIPVAWGSAISTGTFYFVAYGHNASTNEIWISVNAGTPVTASHSSGVNDGTGDFVIGASLSQSLFWDGMIDELFFFKRDIRSDLATFYAAGAGQAYPWSGGGPTYTLTAGQGSYTLTGQTAGLRAARKLTAAQGSFTLTGQSAGLLARRILTASQGAYTLTGQAAGLKAARKLTAAQGSYTLTGQSASLLANRILSAGQGSFALTGQAAVLKAARRIAAGQGSFVLTGQDVTLTYSGGGVVVVPLLITEADAFRIRQRRKRTPMVSS